MSKKSERVHGGEVPRAPVGPLSVSLSVSTLVCAVAGSDFGLCDLGHFALPPFSADGPQQRLPFLLPGERRGWVRAYSAQPPPWHPPTLTFFSHESEDSASFWDSW